MSSVSPERRGLYGPESVAWRLNREAMLLLAAGPRALLMQIAHPSVAAGVDEHSDFRTDPWARLRGTLRSYLRIVYGTGSSARAEIRRLNALHRSIRGAGYSARDPRLSMWVHATLVDSTIAAYEAWVEPLTTVEVERYYAETVPIGRAFGVPPDLLPADFVAFERYMEEMLAEDSPVRVSPTARELARHVLRPTLAPLWAPLGLVPAAAYSWTLWPSVALLPARLREEYGLSQGPIQRAVASWLEAGWRAWRPTLPPSFRQMPQALAADRRIEGGDGAEASVTAAGTGRVPNDG